MGSIKSIGRERGVEVYVGGELFGAFSSLKEASLATGVSTDKICNICRGRRRASNGFAFKYVSEDIVSIDTKELEYILEGDADLFDDSLFDTMGGERLMKLGRETLNIFNN